jgi:hypothetical protein
MLLVCSAQMSSAHASPFDKVVVKKVNLNSDKQLNESFLLRYKLQLQSLLNSNNTICYNKQSAEKGGVLKVSALAAYLALGLKNSYIILLDGNASSLSHFMGDEDEQERSKESLGAKLFVVLMLGLYAAITMVLLIGKVKPSTENNQEKRDLARQGFLLHDVEEQTATKKILEQLKDPGYRDQIWSIYRTNGTTNNNSLRCDASEISASQLKISEAEKNTLRDIDKKIAIIQKHDKKLEARTVDYLDLKSSPLNATRSSRLHEGGRQLGSFKSQVGFHKLHSRSLFVKSPMKVNFQENAELLSVLKSWRASNFREKLGPSVDETIRGSSLKNNAKINSNNLNRDSIEKFSSSFNQNNSNKNYYYTITGSSFKIVNQKLRQDSPELDDDSTHTKGCFNVAKAPNAAGKFNERIPLIKISTDHESPRRAGQAARGGNGLAKVFEFEPV